MIGMYDLINEGKLRGTYEGPVAQHKYGGLLGRPGQCLHVEIPEGMEVEATKATNTGTEEEPVWEVVEDATLLAEVTQAKEDAKWIEIRNCRDKCLGEDVDKARNYMIWAETTGTPWDGTKKAEWMGYRQQLLDMPQVIQNDLDDSTLSSVLDVVIENYLPTKPEL